MRTLTDQERSGVERYRGEDDRRRAVVSRGMLRTILSAALDCAPGEVEFTIGVTGKPRLSQRHDADMEFNVSHSGEWVLIGVSSTGRVGVDIELVRPLPDRDDLVHRFFAPGEARAIQAVVDDAERTTAFFSCWTRKEAYLKAIGAGLHVELDSFEVAPLPGGPAEIISIDGSCQAAAAWRLWTASPAPGYHASVATDSSGAIRAAYWSGTRGIVNWER